MTPAARRALHDSTLVHTVPGRFQVQYFGFAGEARGATRAEVAAMAQNITALAGVLKRTPSLAPPIGSDVVFSYAIESGSQPGVPHVLTSRPLVSFMVYEVEPTKLGRGDGLNLFEFSINTLPCGEPGPAPATGPRAHGFPVFDDAVVITRRTASLCVPVTRAEYLTGALADARKSASPPSTSIASGAAQTDPTIIAIQRQLDGALREARASVVAIQQHLASMSPAERAAPAWVSGTACQHVYDCLTEPGAADAHMLVRANPAFFDPARPSDIQLLMVRTTSHESGRTWGGPDASYIADFATAALNGLDWSGLSALVR